MAYEYTAIPREVSYNAVYFTDDDVSSMRSTSTSSSSSAGESSDSSGEEEEEEDHEQHHVYALPSFDTITQQLPMFSSEIQALRTQRRQKNKRHRIDHGESTSTMMYYTERIPEPNLSSPCPSDEESIHFIESVESVESVDSRKSLGSETAPSSVLDSTEQWKFDVDDETGMLRHALPSGEIYDETTSSQQKPRVLLPATRLVEHSEVNERSHKEHDLSFFTTTTATESPLPYNEEIEWNDLGFSSFRHLTEHEHKEENMSTTTSNSIDLWFSEPAATSSSSRRRPTKLRQRTMSLNSRIEMWQHQLGKPFRSIPRIKFPTVSGQMSNDCFGRGILESVLQQSNDDPVDPRHDTTTDNEDETIFFDERTTNSAMKDLEWDNLCSSSESSMTIRDNTPIWRQKVVCGSPTRRLLLSTSGGTTSRYASNSSFTKTNPEGRHSIKGSGDEYCQEIDWEALTMITTQSTQESYEDERINLVTYQEEGPHYSRPRRRAMAHSIETM